MNSHILSSVGIAALVMFAIYRRVRRNFGRQPIRPKRTWARVAIFVVLTLVVALSTVRDVRVGEGLLGGLLGGAALGLLGLRLTRFDISGQRDFYTPDPWLGLALTALLLGRLIYRFMVMYPAMQSAIQEAQSGAAFGQIQRSPLTLALFGLLFGYYICYFAGILMHHRSALALLRAAPSSGEGR